jgi:hypothetical protein
MYVRNVCVFTYVCITKLVLVTGPRIYEEHVTVLWIFASNNTCVSIFASVLFGVSNNFK